VRAGKNIANLDAPGEAGIISAERNERAFFPFWPESIE